MKLFVCEVNVMLLNVMMIVKTNWKVFLNLNRKILNLKKITIVCLEENIKKNVIFILFDQLIMKCICKELKNQHCLFSMISDVIKVILKVYHGNKSNKITQSLYVWTMLTKLTFYHLIQV